MKKTIITDLLVIALLAFPVLVFGLDSGIPGGFNNQMDFLPGEILVKYKEATYAEAKLYYQKRWGLQTIGLFKSIGVDHVQLPAGMSVERALKILRKGKFVEYAEPNYYRYADIIPDDFYFGQQWGLDNTGQDDGVADADIDAPEAWDVTTGSDTVVIAVIDSGLDYSHPDLAANIWINPGEIDGNGIDDDNNGYVDDVRGWDFIQNNNAPGANDSRGHGTHVAGIIAAEANNVNGVAGVNWSARIMPLRFINSFGVGTTSDAVLAMEYANAKGADVINNSWGGGGYSQALKDAIDVSPALVVCAAGNEGSDNDTIPHYPSSYPSDNVIAVAATDNTDKLAIFSNFGATSVDVAAPGQDILSCIPGRQTIWSDDFDDGELDGWVIGGKKNKLTWDLTDTQSFSASYSLTESPSGDYMNRAKTWIKGPVIDLSQHSGGKLTFQLKGTSQAVRDELFVEVSTDDVNWSSMVVGVSGVGYFVGISGTFLTDWSQATVDLEPYDGFPSLYFRFNFTSDRSITADGWYIDDVAVTAASSIYDGTEYQVKSGTSMAAPHVSGIAALLKSVNMEWTPQQLKEAIENSVDAKPSLSGKVNYGGRVNAFNALTY